jgi:hypothetical protein
MPIEICKYVHEIHTQIYIHKHRIHSYGHS